MIHQMPDGYQTCVLKSGASFARLAANRAQTPIWRRFLSAWGWRFLVLTFLFLFLSLKSDKPVDVPNWSCKFIDSF